MTSLTRPAGGRAWLLTVLLSTFTAAGAGAQVATISGKVTTVDGAPIRGANVMIAAINVSAVTGTGGLASTKLSSG